MSLLTPTITEAVRDLGPTAQERRRIAAYAPSKRCPVDNCFQVISGNKIACFAHIKQLVAAELAAADVPERHDINLDEVADYANRQNLAWPVQE